MMDGCEYALFRPRGQEEKLKIEIKKKREAEKQKNSQKLSACSPSRSLRTTISTGARKSPRCLKF
ncbi:MAG: hypothetical protein LBR53_00885 [Deltaproteobacteria bacterium]|jgi:hypothetical protein|nr:hypothetical protein [Deltaproteobacteria bacterium]